ncbi:MAG TPA: DNA polymerase III subunit alpha [bacterium]|nr:DNA polymerase III subunit alpha [bacterium]
MFVHLNVHSHYSFCRGANAIEDLCLAAKKRGMDALALTDTNGIYGLIWFLQIAREIGVKSIIGAELVSAGLRALLLVESRKGYGNLCRIISHRHQDTNFSLSEELIRYQEGLIVLTEHISLLNSLRSNLPENNLFVEVLPGPRRLSLLNYARKSAIPPVATNNVHFINPEDFALHRLLRAIDCNVALSRLAPAELASPDSWLKTAAQMAGAFPDCPAALSNTREIADRCLSNLDLGDPVFPTFSGTDNGSAFELLKQRCYQGARKRYGAVSEAVKKRLEYELQIIRDKGFAPYFLVVQDIVQQSRRTCGRGSAAASIVSYCLEITHVDPIAHNLFFERFLNSGRKDPPDIDVDFPWDERDAVLDYVFEKYGMQHTAMIANHVGFKARAAVREVAKVYGLPENEINSVTRKLSEFYRADRVRDLIDNNPAYQHDEFDRSWREILTLAEKLQGCPRNLSVHCGGVVITPKPINQYVATEPAPKGVNIVQWEKDQSEDAGLVKIDLLGNRSLAVIRDALAAIKRNYDVDIRYELWNPLDDARTQQLIRNGDTIGVFYVESPAMRLLQKKARTGDFDHLVIHSSIIRPAANDYIVEYLKRLHGAPYQPLHPLLDEILQETFGIMVYQEDVSKVAMALAGFDPAEADDLRRILSKKRIGRKMLDFRSKFFAGARRKGVESKTIERIWDMILSFSGYSFCKPHSASFAMVSYKSCYLRAHYPAEFIAAVISNQGGYYSTFAYISEARRMGLTVLLPEINHSQWHYTAKDRQLRVGFMQLKNIQRKAIEHILAERDQNGRFRSFDNFLKRSKIDPNDIKILIKGGVFDEIEPGRSRPELMWRMLFCHNRQLKKNNATLSLFDETPASLPRAKNYDLNTQLQHETETLGFLISRHPLTLYQDRITKLTYVPGQNLQNYVGKIVTTIGWLVTRKMTRTKKNELMEFISFEDTTAIYETIFFPETYRKFCYMLSLSRPYVLKGRVEEEFGAVTLNVSQLRFL